MLISQDGRSFQNIPAILPYEARVALLKEFRHRDNRNLLKSLEVGFSIIFEKFCFYKKHVFVLIVFINYHTFFI